MKRTLEVMESELEVTKEQLKPLQKKASELEDEIKRYKLDNKLYHPMSELANYKGKDILFIELVMQNVDSTLDTVYIHQDDIFEVTDDGHLYYSSYAGGIIEYSRKRHKYIRRYYGNSIDYNCVGFLDVELRDKIYI